MENVYEKGTIKVVWINDGEKIFSKMFESEDKAVQFSSGKRDFLIFKLLKEKGMEEFTWELLPHGKYKTYKTLLNIYKKGLLPKLLSIGSDK